MVMLPALPEPVLLAEILAPLLKETDWTALREMLPPAPTEDELLLILVS